MKAILRFDDGSVKITTVPHSEDATGQVYVIGQFTSTRGSGCTARLEFTQITTIGRQQVAEYREISTGPIQRTG